MLTKHLANKVFTPTTAAALTFVEREQPNDRLVRALQTPGMQIVVYGRSGCGKTTLLENKLRQTYERHVTSRCVQGTSFDDLLMDAFDQIAPYFLSSFESGSAASRSSSFGATLKAVKLAHAYTAVTHTKETANRALPPQLTPTLLARTLGEVSACWVLEDFHKVSEREKVRLAQVMKLFMDMANEYPDIRIIAIGAVSTARQVVQSDAEMSNRLAQIDVPLMSADELDAIMTKGSELLRIGIPETLRSTIRHCTNGLPAICHQLCLNMCQRSGIVETLDHVHEFSEEDLVHAIQEWVAGSKDSLAFAYDKAVRAKRIKTFDNCRMIIEALGQLPAEGGTHHDILTEIRRTHRDYPPGNLTNYLHELESDARGTIITRDPTSDRCYFTSPMMHAYVRSITHERANRRSKESPRVSVTELLAAYAHDNKVTFEFAFGSKFIEWSSGTEGDGARSSGERDDGSTAERGSDGDK